MSTAIKNAIRKENERRARAESLSKFNIGDRIVSNNYKGVFTVTNIFERADGLILNIIARNQKGDDLFGFDENEIKLYSEYGFTA